MQCLAHSSYSINISHCFFRPFAFPMSMHRMLGSTKVFTGIIWMIAFI